MPPKAIFAAVCRGPAHKGDNTQIARATGRGEGERDLIEHLGPVTPEERSVSYSNTKFPCGPKLNWFGFLLPKAFSY